MSLCRYDTSKPCENHGTSGRTCIDCILGKIRAEVEGSIREETVVDNAGGEYERIISTIDPDDVLQIIDKYRKGGTHE